MDDSEGDSPVESGGGVQVIDRWEGGVGWLAHPEETLQRASHALAVDGEVWIVDPVDSPGLDDLLDELGDVVGVVVGLDRHKRDAAEIANRHGVSVHLPRAVAGVASDIDAPIEILDDYLGDTGYRTITVVDNVLWSEVALHDEGSRTLLVSEAVGTAPHYLASGERLGVHPALRPWPPRRALSRLAPERILVGHGRGIHERASMALGEALHDARRNAPRLYAKAFSEMLAGRGG